MHGEVLKAILDLAALALIWGGTMVITLGGIPALLPRIVTIGGNRITIGGKTISIGKTTESLEANQRYWKWAWPGACLITLGAAWQTLGPLAILFPSHHWLMTLGLGATS